MDVVRGGKTIGSANHAASPPSSDFFSLLWRNLRDVPRNRMTFWGLGAFFILRYRPTDSHSQLHKISSTHDFLAPRLLHPMQYTTSLPIPSNSYSHSRNQLCTMTTGGNPKHKIHKSSKYVRLDSPHSSVGAGCWRGEVREDH